MQQSLKLFNNLNWKKIVSTQNTNVYRFSIFTVLLLVVGTFEMDLVATYSDKMAFKMMCHIPLATIRNIFCILLRSSPINDNKLHQAPKDRSNHIYQHTKSQLFASNSSKYKMVFPHILNYTHDIHAAAYKLVLVISDISFV